MTGEDLPIAELGGWPNDPVVEALASLDRMAQLEIEAVLYQASETVFDAIPESAYFEA